MKATARCILSIEFEPDELDCILAALAFYVKHESGGRSREQAHIIRDGLQDVVRRNGAVMDQLETPKSCFLPETFVPTTPPSPPALPTND